MKNRPCNWCGQIHSPVRKAKRRALIVGTNYVGTRSELRGCINDVVAWCHILGDIYGYDEMIVLKNKDASTKNIKNAMLHLKALTAPGDILHFLWSGHGSNIPDPKEADGTSEIICPDDFDWSPDKMITDDDFLKYIADFPVGARFIATLDCCHSGDAMRSMVANRMIVNPETRGMKKVTRPIVFNDGKRHGILLAGCHSDQTSADAYIAGDYHGAFTYYQHQVLKQSKYTINYEQLILKTAELLKRNHYTQIPTLECDPSMNEDLFLGI